MATQPREDGGGGTLGRHVGSLATVAGMAGSLAALRVPQPSLVPPLKQTHDSSVLDLPHHLPEHTFSMTGRDKSPRKGPGEMQRGQRQSSSSRHFPGSLPPRPPPGLVCETVRGEKDQGACVGSREGRCRRCHPAPRSARKVNQPGNQFAPFSYYQTEAIFIF